MLKKIKKYRDLYMGLLILMMLIIISSLVWILFTLDDSSNTLQLLLVIVISIAFIVTVIWLKPRVYYYSMLFQLLILKANASNPVDVKYHLTSPAFVLQLKKFGYQLIQTYEDFSVLYQVNTEKHPYVRKHVLQIFVLIYKNELTKRDPRIVKVINQLENDLKKQRIRFLNYSIFFIQSVDTFDKESLDNADQIVFEKQGKTRINEINVLFLPKHKLAYFLHSDAYAPNLLYKYSVELLKSIII